eukprot:4340150-Prymnesium_polylepis.1
MAQLRRRPVAPAARRHQRAVGRRAATPQTATLALRSPLHSAALALRNALHTTTLALCTALHAAALTLALALSPSALALGTCLCQPPRHTRRRAIAQRRVTTRTQDAATLCLQAKEARRSCVQEPSHRQHAGTSRARVKATRGRSARTHRPHGRTASACRTRPARLTHRVGARCVSIRCVRPTRGRCASARCVQPTPATCAPERIRARSTWRSAAAHGGPTSCACPRRRGPSSPATRPR